MADEIKVPIVSTYDDADAKKAIAQAEKIENLDPELDIGADASDAEKKIEAVSDEAKTLDKVTPEVEITGDSTDAERKIDKTSEAAEALSREDVDIAIEAHDRASAELRKIRDEMDKTEAESPINVDVKTGGGFDKLTSKLDKLPGQFGEIGSLLAGKTGIAAGAGALATGLLAAAGYAADLATDANNVASYIGTSTEEASRLLAVLSTVGVESGDLMDIVGQVNSVLSQTPALAQQLGINLKNAAPAQVFLDAYDAISKIIDPQQRLIAMQQVFGEEGARQIGAVVARYGDLRTAMQNVDASKVISPQDVKEAQQFQKALADVTVQFQKMAITAGENVLPVLTRLLGLFEKLQGFGGAIYGAGKEVSLRQFTELLKDNGYNIDQARAKLIEYGFGLAEVDSALIQVGYSSGETERETRRLAGAMGESATATDLAAARSAALANAQEVAKTAQEALTTASDAYVASLNEQLDAMFGFADAGLAQTKAQEDFIETAKKTVEIGKTKGKTSQEYADAVKAERDALLGAAEAQVRMADELAKSQGKTLTQTQKIDNYNKSLMDNARYATPAARTAAYDYLIQLNQIPEDKATVIQALIDQGRFDEANAIINETSKAREVAITADAHTEEAEAEIQKLIKTRNLLITAQLIAKGAAGYGGRTGDPEAGRTMVPVGAAPAPSITVNMAPGARGVDVLRQISGQSRRSGRRYGTPVVHYARRGLP